MLRALHLNFLQHQAIEHLLLQHALRGQLDFLFLQPLLDRGHLLVQLALENQAVIDDGRDSVEQFAVNADVAGLRKDGDSSSICAATIAQNWNTLRIGQNP